MRPAGIVISSTIIEYGMGMALDLGFVRSLVTALNEAQIYSTSIPVPQTVRELDMYRKIIEDPRLATRPRESLKLITTVYEPGGS